MPIFEYTCKDCKGGFEELVRSEEQVVACPNCGSNKTEKRLSVFSAGSSAQSQSGSAVCGRPGCGSGFT